MIEIPQSGWKFTCFGLGFVWLMYTFGTIAYYAGRASYQEQWDFPDWIFGLSLLVMGLWLGSFILALRGWPKLAVISWLAIILAWGLFWIATIAG